MHLRTKIKGLLKVTPALVALTFAAAFSAVPVNAKDKINCIFPFWFGFAPVFVAQEEGYFASEDLEVTTAFDNDRANVLPAMSTGAIECTMRTIGESMSRPRQADTTGTIIGTIDISVGADGVVASGDIKSIEDLIGKTMAGEINHPGTTLVQHALARELAPDVQVNSVAPGPVDTPMLALENMSQEWIDREIDNPLERVGKPREIAALVRFLCGPDAGFFTGQTLSPNGGAVMI